VSFKHLTVGCLHLYDRELRSTKKMVENSRVILDELYKHLLENEDIILLNINGDIQHKTPIDKHQRKEVAYWRKMFRQIGELMQSRFKQFKGYSLAGASDELKKDFKDGKVYPIFTTKGNHDIDNDLGHTFFDDLEEEGLIINVRGLLVRTETERTYFSYRDYDTKNRKIPNFKNKTNVIGIEHNNILHDESSLWNVPGAEDKFLKAEDVVPNTDVVIMHHVHEKVDPLYVETAEKSHVLWQPGAIGRTSLIDEAKRDVGYGAVMEFNKIDRFKTVEFDLIPYMEYFTYKKMMDKKKYKNEFENFDLKMGEYERISTNYVDDINSFEDIEDDVKEYAIKVMDGIESNRDK